MNRPITMTVLLMASFALVLATASCSRSKKAPSTTAAAQPASPAALKPPPARVAEGEPLPSGDNVVAQPSEHIAEGKPDPNCDDCKRSDAQGGPVYHGSPEMKLDEATLADVRTTVQDTCDLLSKGVDILEANVKRPEKATKALLDYQKKNKIEIERIFQRADEVRARLRVVGYDQDIPAEIQPEFEERMGAIQGRLEKMRLVYRDRPEVLAAFGGFFPRKR